MRWAVAKMRPVGNPPAHGRFEGIKPDHLVLGRQIGVVAMSSAARAKA